MDLTRWLRSTALICLFITVFIHPSQTRYHGKRQKRQNGANLYLSEKYIIPGGEGDPSEWSVWSSPSECSRTCGGGVSYQTRECYRIGENGETLCQGGDTKYFTCNTQSCPDEDPDFRSIQCSKFDSKPFDGQRYEWIPYKKAPNPCELNCMPRGERFYYRHLAKVVDGTPCNDESLDVCVDGKCQPVGCDMMLGSDAKEDNCRKCGGDGTSCKTINGVVDTNTLQVGYNDIFVIPEGATNIDIKELEPSNNYLAARNKSGRYYLNGNWRIDFPRPMNYAGSWWHYDRKPQGFAAPDHLSSMGPTNEAIIIVLLYQDRNVGVKYEYSIPENSVKTNLDTYQWVHTAFGPCSATCGGGTQTRDILCNIRTTLDRVDDSLCDQSARPSETQECGTGACLPKWVESEWGKCSKPCGQDGMQNRTVTCEKITAEGVAEKVEDSVCLELAGNKPADKQECNRDTKNCPKFHLGPWKPCDKLCGEGKQTRKVTCYKEEEGKKKVLSDSECNEEKPEEQKTCILEPCEGVDWIASSWSGCTECGQEEETRSIKCANKKGKTYDEKFCPVEKPETAKKCEEIKKCDFQWYASEWNKCSTLCGNGTQSRVVICGEFDGTSVTPAPDDSKCNAELKPESKQDCEIPEDKCKAQWFTGPWQQCSKTCGVGKRSREIICLENGEISLNCAEELIEFTEEDCNQQKCEDDETIPVDATSTTISDDEEEECDYDDYADEVVDFDERIDAGVSDGIDLDADVSTEVTLMTDDLMMSDATGFETESTDESTEGPLSTVEGSGEGSTGADLSTVEGSGDEDSSTETITTKDSLDTSSASELTERSTINDGSTELGSSEMTGQTDLSTEDVSGVTDISAEMSGSTDTHGSDRTESSVVTEMSGSTDGNTESTDNSDSTKDAASTDVPASTESSKSSDGSEATEALTEEFTGTTEEGGPLPDISLTLDLNETPDADIKISTATSDSSSLLTDSSSTDTSVSTDSTETTDSTTDDMSTTTTADLSSTTPEEECEEDTPCSKTKSSDSTETSTANSGSPESTTDIGSTDGSGSEGTTDISATTEDGLSTDSSHSTDESATGQTTQESDISKDIEKTDTTESGATEVTESVQQTGSTESSASSDITETNDDNSLSTKMAESTDDSQSTTSDGSTDSLQSTKASDGTEATDITGQTESSDASESTTFSADKSTVSGATDDVSGSTEPTMDVTTSSGSDETTVDIWSSSVSEVTDEEDAGTTPNTLETAIRMEHKPKKCKPRKKKSDCKNSEFGCCSDNKTKATGPFDEGCSVVETCDKTKFGCCSDGVSPAKGKANKGCPKSQCAETLFGCCPDKYTPAEGEDNEGCPEPTTTMAPTTMAPAEESTDEVTDIRSDSETTKTPLPCSEGKYGCCPDGETDAGGENFDGCEEKEKSEEKPAEGCESSSHGCCPDRRTPASGPNNEGCSACATEPYGCCVDGKTPSHGPYGEGCNCLDSEFGCCPDNINPARGPDQEGCECENSPFGCCPDKKTPASGYNNEGCGCQFTEFGCCPDKLTMAPGPKFEGCPCHTMQFGCCPDGITVPLGPHNYGCYCSQTQFDCCSDEQTPAKGPEQEGCTCAESKFGCCPDGVTAAEGDKFEGCETVPEAPQKACSLPKETGPCNNFTIRHFFDTAYGACARFWYGGCEGNGNNFESADDCKATCEDYKGKESCLLPRSPGPCPGTEKMWYYDADRSRCEEFIYGGCFGNTNRFATIEECQKTCSVDENIPPCEQPADKGPCDGNFERWYYDNQTDVCMPFQYGGCQGNKNNYPTEHACTYHCKQPGVHKELCKLPKETGTCDERHARWHYSESDRKCLPFYYTGCGGNKNNFQTLQQCEEGCPKPVAKDVCEFPPEVGECQNYVARWYYNTKEEHCRQFYWGGCGGNGNNFADEDACMNRCKQSVPEPEPEVIDPREPDREQHRPDTSRQSQDKQACFIEPERGPCENDSTRFYYNSHEGVCDVFAYGGCEGNANNFESLENCENLCSDVQNLCSLPPVYGRCAENVTRWYYDERARRCHNFAYSGCYGNKNNFESEDECMNYCDRNTDERYPQPEPAPESVDHCNEPRNEGNCHDQILSFYFNPETQRCEAFYYSGCDGNNNRFTTEQQCERQCGSYRGVDVCKESPDPGPCDQYQTRYYYNNAQRKCEPFMYGGCKGSANRFENIAECESVCIERLEPTIKDDRAICFLPVNTGNCTGGGQETRRWYYDDLRGSCVMFIYSGCAGNQNNFISYASCVDTCIIPEEPFVPEEENNNIENQCDQDAEHCRTLRCPYGVRRSYDRQTNCERCDCDNPCEYHECEAESRCTVDVVGQEFVAVCRKENKPGECPALSGDNDRCDRECSTDAECRGEYKCCQDGCGTRCVLPAVPEDPYREPATQLPPVVYPGDRPVALEPKPQHELDVSTPAGGVAILRCFATGLPAPTITWNFGSVTINTNQGRFILTGNGDLTIVQVHRSDSGTYVCVAENGIGEPQRREVNLEVEGPTEREAYISGPTNETVYVQLNQPIQMRCPAGGHPAPSVTWWRGKERIPRSGEHHTIDDNNALILSSVSLHHLGVYTCEAWNGRGRPASIEKTLVTTTQIHTDDPNDLEYLRYVIQPAHAPTARPEWPYRPHRPSTTRLPIVVVPLPSRVPASAVIRRDPSNTYVAGSEVLLTCEVDGVPTPNVTWYKNGQQLQAPTSKYEITEVPHRLVIFNAQREDTGRYACEARNSFSYNRNEETVTIESSVYVNPDCVDSPHFANCALIVKGNYCTHQYYGKFCCRSCTLAGQLRGHPNAL